MGKMERNVSRQSIPCKVESESSSWSDKPLLSKHVRFATPNENEPPIAFLKVPGNGRKRKVLYPNSKAHTHYHPLVHGEGAIDKQNETQDVDGENDDVDRDKNMMLALKQRMDRNHNDLNDIKRVLYSIQKKQIDKK